MMGAQPTTVLVASGPMRDPVVPRAAGGLGIWLVCACLVTYPLELHSRIGLFFQCALLLWFVLQVPLRMVVGTPLCLLMIAGHVAILSELLSERPDLTFILKWIVNPFLLIAAASAINISADLVRIERAIRLTFLTVLSAQLVSAVLSGPSAAVGALADLVGGLATIGAVPSDAYYRAEGVFGAFLLTKNIMAAYLVCLYGVHLYLRRSIDWNFLLLVVCVMALCFSRQGLVMLLLVLGAATVFRLDSSGRFRFRLSVAFCGLTIAVVVMLSVVVDLHSPQDGMSERLQLYRAFFQASLQDGVGILGYGYHGMSDHIQRAGIPIDNFHFFAFNLIYAFGVVCFLLWSLAVAWLACRLPDWRARVFGLLPLLLNLSMQNFGIEFGTLIGLVLVVRAGVVNGGEVSVAGMLTARS